MNFYQSFVNRRKKRKWKETCEKKEKKKKKNRNIPGISKLFLFFGFYLFQDERRRRNPPPPRIKGSMTDLVESRKEDLVLSSFKDTGDREGLGFVVLEEVVGGIGKGLGFLFLGGSLSDPGEDLESGVKDKGVLAVKRLDGDILDFDHLHLSGLIGETEELLLGLDGGVGGGRSDFLLSSEELPELVGMGVPGVLLIEDPDVGLSSSLVVEGTGEFGGLGPLHSSAFLSVHLVDVLSGVEDEDVSAVQGVGGEGDFANNHVLLALEVEKAVSVLLDLDVLESRVDSSLEDLDLLEVGKEELGFVSLDFAVLDGVSIEVVVELDGLVGGSSVLVLGRVLSNPEVDIVAEFLRVGGLLVGSEEDVRVSGVELSVFLLGPGDNLEFLNAPDLNSDLLASSLPGFLALGGGLFDLVLRRKKKENVVEERLEV